MLRSNIQNFLQYCKVCNFSDRSLEALTNRLNEFTVFMNSISIDKISTIAYQHLLQFIADFGHSSEHVKKSRVWALRQFFHFLKTNNIIKKNIALALPYPKIEKKVPKYLTIDEFNQILNYFVLESNSTFGLRNLIIIMILGFLGLRLSAVTKLNVEDVDLSSRLIWVREKGQKQRNLPIPEILYICLCNYLNTIGLSTGPLFLSKQKKRISERVLQDIFKSAVATLGIEKHLHAHLFRHTAGTLLNKVAGPDITQHVLGHAHRQSTQTYVHLNPDQYAIYMNNHPYMFL